MKYKEHAQISKATNPWWFWVTKAHFPVDVRFVIEKSHWSQCGSVEISEKRMLIVVALATDVDLKDLAAH